MSSLTSQSNTRSAAAGFSPADIAFALAWEIYAPGLVGWTVLVENEEEGSDVILVDPPLAFDNGFTLRRDGLDTVVSWRDGTRRTASVRDALQLICPLAPEELAAADALADAPVVAL